MAGNFNEVLFEFMKMHFLDEEGLAIEAQIPRKTLHAYIYEGKKPDRSDARDIARVLNTSAEVLFPNGFWE